MIKKRLEKKLKKAGAKLIKAEFLQKRVVFNLPRGHEIPGGWIRIRDEGDKITMSLKIIDGKKMENQKETLFKISSFKKGEFFLKKIGCQKKAYQESKRELWLLDKAEVTIDEWPFLEPFVEIEGKSKKQVKKVAQKLGFDFSKALFCSVDALYGKKYNLAKEIINNQTPKIIFGKKNPFLKNQKK